MWPNPNTIQQNVTLAWWCWNSTLSLALPSAQDPVGKVDTFSTCGHIPHPADYAKCKQAPGWLPAMTMLAQCTSLYLDVRVSDTPCSGKTLPYWLLIPVGGPILQDNLELVPNKRLSAFFIALLIKLEPYTEQFYHIHIQSLSPDIMYLAGNVFDKEEQPSSSLLPIP